MREKLVRELEQYDTINVRHIAGEKNSDMFTKEY